MNNLEPKPEADRDTEEAPAKGPNLVLIYSLIAFALVAAMFWPG